MISNNKINRVVYTLYLLIIVEKISTVFHLK